MTDTLKRQPWRIIWPTTKKYDAAAPETATITATGARPAKPVTRGSHHARAVEVAATPPAELRSGPLLTD